MHFYMFAVPALHKQPDIEVLDNVDGAQFALIEHLKVYNGKWKTGELNTNEYNETGEIKYYIENWLFQYHRRERVTRWTSRKALPLRLQREAFILMQSDTDKGTFTFKQNTQTLAKPAFIIGIIVVRKVTENLELMYTSSFLSFMPMILNASGRKAIREFCSKWSDSPSEKINTELKKCPCTLQLAKMDPDLSQDFTCSVTQPGCHENVNAHRCYIMKLNDT